MRIVKLMDELFAIDATTREQRMNHTQCHAVRNARAPALLAELRHRIA
jgi:hypothetical protein